MVEIDAASHGGVDDARDLRERAFYSPAAARFKIYIVDEAHMVSPQGFNALLKVVEPPHLKFIFATTEPDRVLGTIKSRTHHYPFRLVPPRVLQDYLAHLCEAEGATVGPGVLPMVVRAGAGSVRDALSVLDQLIAGAGPEGVTHGYAAGLLGYTDAALLDDVVDAFAAADAASVFELVDRVVDSGIDPRRFLADLLERLRDLIVLQAVPDAATKGMLHAPPDQVERMLGQAGRFGPADLTRIADVVSTGLTEMRGATAPRLHLELVCARALLPGADDDAARGLGARMDRLELRFAIGAATERPGAEPARAAAPAGPAAATERPGAEPARAAAPTGPPAPTELSAPTEPALQTRRGRPGRAGTGRTGRRRPGPARRPWPVADGPRPGQAAPAGHLAAAVRQGAGARRRREGADDRVPGRRLGEGLHRRRARRGAAAGDHRRGRGRLDHRRGAPAGRSGHPWCPAGRDRRRPRRAGGPAARRRRPREGQGRCGTPGAGGGAPR